jgi:hypothetical protein
VYSCADDSGRAASDLQGFACDGEASPMSHVRACRSLRRGVVAEAIQPNGRQVSVSSAQIRVPKQQGDGTSLGLCSPRYPRRTQSQLRVPLPFFLQGSSERDPEFRRMLITRYNVAMKDTMGMQMIWCCALGMALPSEFLIGACLCERRGGLLPPAAWLHGKVSGHSVTCFQHSVRPVRPSPSYSPVHLLRSCAPVQV